MILFVRNVVKLSLSLSRSLRVCARRCVSAEAPRVCVAGGEVPDCNSKCLDDEPRKDTTFLLMIAV
jgi:hypothetical protein